MLRTDAPTCEQKKQGAYNMRASHASTASAPNKHGHRHMSQNMRPVKAKRDNSIHASGLRNGVASYAEWRTLVRKDRGCRSRDEFESCACIIIQCSLSTRTRTPSTKTFDGILGRLYVRLLQERLHKRVTSPRMFYRGRIAVVLVSRRLLVSLVREQRRQ